MVLYYFIIILYILHTEDGHILVETFMFIINFGLNFKYTIFANDILRVIFLLFYIYIYILYNLNHV